MDYLQLSQSVRLFLPDTGEPKFITESSPIFNRKANMAFISTIVVEDVIRSRTLYENILNCKVSGDFGIYNVGFEGGLSLYKKTLFQDLVGSNIEILNKSNNFVLYFEVDNLEDLEKVIEESGFNFIHKIKEQPWGQNIFRFYDYDHHIVEIAEIMTTVIYRMHQEGKTIEEIANKTGYSKEQVSQELSYIFERGV